jgi:UDP-glucose 4-epimerase
MSTILLTGGCGFIGSHIAIELLNKNTNCLSPQDNIYIQSYQFGIQH